jgi:hypothetical protein
MAEHKITHPPGLDAYTVRWLKPGDEIEIQTGTGEWRSAVAGSAPEWHRHWNCYSVRITGGGWVDVNWPLDHVRKPQVPQD